MIKRNYSFFAIIILQMILFCFIAFKVTTAQENFLLTVDEMNGYNLIRETTFRWTIGEGDKAHDVIQQKWQTKDLENLYIEYCEFQGEIEAIFGTACASQTLSTPFKWDSPNGLIVGDGTWTALSKDALFFVRGNIGIKINMDSTKELISVSEKTINKIESNLSPDIISFEEVRKQKQIPISEYQTIIEPVINSPQMVSYSFNTVWDSKWIVDSTNLTIGIRKEWQNSNGAVVSVDISKFDTNTEAQKAIAIRSEIIPTSRIYNLDNLDSLKSNILTLKSNKIKKTSYLMLGIKDNLTVHFYYFNPDSIDWDLFYSIAEKISEQIINF